MMKLNRRRIRRSASPPQQRRRRSSFALFSYINTEEQQQDRQLPVSPISYFLLHNDQYNHHRSKTFDDESASKSTVEARMDLTL
mmetsp:Transcript_18406/g.27809  ORF Transcript_18406/g.27809 Transcript_18406/m.27809 type:complete len:84 (+) Transcript_18406:161-412(+)